MVDLGTLGGDLSGASAVNEGGEVAGVSTASNPNTGHAVLWQSEPATKDDCKRGGWRQFGFHNQGQCVAFVNHQP
jgi:uncharacterized membrane protein